MKNDYSEFIARHHKSAQPLPSKPLKKAQYPWLLAALTLFLYTSIILFVATASHLDELTIMIAVLAFVLATLVGFVAHRSYHVHNAQESRLKLLREVLEGSRGARLITDGADNTVYFNQKFEKLCAGMGKPGYDSLVKLFQNNQEALAHFRMLADQAHRGLSDSIELQSRDEKMEGWYLVAAQPVAGHAGYIHWRVDDVTLKHTTDRAVREEREKLIDFTDNAPVGFFSIDENGRFVFANATFARWIGEDLTNLLERGTLHTYLAEPPVSAQPYDLHEKGGLRQVAEVRMKGPAGKTFLAAINQTVVREPDGRVRTRAVVNDLTAEREMSRALQASEDRFQRFFEEAPLGIILIDKKGVVKDSNSAFAVMLGIEINEVEGKHFADFVAPESQDAASGAIGRIASGEYIGGAVEVVLIGKDRTVVAQMHGRKFRDGGTVLHFINLNEQKALEAQFVQSQKMQAIGQLAGGVAHDFNNLLTAMIGFCDLLLLRHKPGDPSFADIMQIKQNSNRAANLVRQLLAFSRQQTLRPRVQDITDILTEVSHLLRRLIGASIELELSHGKDLGLVKVDEGQMEQVLINLAVNARDAMGTRGKLRIETENFTNRKPKKVGTEETMPPGHWTVIKVTDTGCGIPKDIIDRIFEPFFTTKEVGHGTGLGLATVYGIVRQTGGYLQVDSEVGKGTTFTIYLPRANEAEEDDDAQKPSLEESTKDLTGTERILLVEDEDAVRTFSTRALTNKGYEVLAASGGDAALALIEKEQKPLDLLISDVVMPGMDGPTLAQKIREASPKLKIIFISGYTEDKLKDYMGENVWFLPKPFTLKQLAAKVKDVLEE